ncbi:NAD(P)/FAD-dependent oxidoreductase [bacterium]|nr:NAD(P)/FAD-dependent oxidoreductase [bacterium]
MAIQNYQYVIVGAGAAGTSAVEGIRERDKNLPIIVFGAEKHLPYERPPLSKKLWFGKKKVENIFLKSKSFFDEAGAKLLLDTRIVGIDSANKTVFDQNGEAYRFGKLLLATGGTPKVFSFPGGNLEEICYFRFLDDFLKVRKSAVDCKSALVIGGGFIGSEMAAALCLNKLDVTLLFSSPYLCRRVFPQNLGKAIERLFKSRGIRVLNEEQPVSFDRVNGKIITRTKTGKIESDMVIAGIGINPDLELARRAELATSNGIIVNEHLQTSHPDIFAAGDNALFPYKALGQITRIEHWDNALTQGKHAGRNMAGAMEEFSYMPYFVSDLFEFGYEAVGEIDPQMEVTEDWVKEFETGVIFFSRDRKLRGAMMCNIWGKLEIVRDLIRRGVGPGSNLIGTIR